MKAISFAKGMLFVYHKIPELSDEIDACVKNFAKFSTNMNYTVLLSAEEYAERIIRCTERKKKLIQLYDKLENALYSCDESNLHLLKLIYFDSMKMDEICTCFNVSKRTMFRRVKLALVQFVKRLIAEGVADPKYLDTLKGEIWIANAIYRIEKSTRGRKGMLNAGR